MGATDRVPPSQQARSAMSLAAPGHDLQIHANRGNSMPESLNLRSRLYRALARLVSRVEHAAEAEEDFESEAAGRFLYCM